MSRIFCQPGEQSVFLTKVCRKIGIKLATLAHMFNLSDRTLRDWKRDKFHASNEVFEKLSIQFGIKMPTVQEVRPEYWSTERRHIQFGTFEGRKKGGLVSQQRRRANPEYYRSLGMMVPNTFYVPKKDEVLAEFCGVVLGDGGLTTQQCIITLNERADASYIPVVSSMIYDLFGYLPGTHFGKTDATVAVTISGIKFTKILQSLGLDIGDKTRKQVGVPDWIKQSLTYSMACVRGLIDTDGGVFKHSYSVNQKRYSYINLNFKNTSRPLIQFVSDVLEKLQYTPKIQGGKNVWLYSQKEVVKYLQEIGSSNLRLFKNVENSRVNHGKISNGRGMYYLED